MKVIKGFFERLLMVLCLLIVAVIIVIEFIIEFPVFLIMFLFFNKEMDLLILAKRLDEKLDTVWP